MREQADLTAVISDISAILHLEGAEDKDEARTTRLSKILPAVTAGDDVVLDFRAVRYATQSYIHALIGEALQKYGDAALEHMEFCNCSPQVKSVVELVVDYSLGGFAEKRGE